MRIGVVLANQVGSVVFCPNNFQQGNDTETELILARNTCTYIRNLLTGEYGVCYFSFDDDCTVYRYGWLLFCLRYYYDQQVVFSKGHRGVPYCGAPWYNINHFSLLDHNGDSFIDHNIYGVTSSENVFTFIWHCQTTQHYFGNGTVPQDELCPYGMPYCWTHNPSMQPWGVSGTQVYLGWVGQSPQFETQANGVWNYAHVAYLFWYYVCNDYQVDAALDVIS